jgi:hypothetical protein
MTQPVLYIRPPAALKERLEQAAKANDRTLNKEVIRRLQESFPDYRR